MRGGEEEDGGEFERGSRDDGKPPPEREREAAGEARVLGGMCSGSILLLAPGGALRMIV